MHPGGKDVGETVTVEEFASADFLTVISSVKIVAEIHTSEKENPVVSAQNESAQDPDPCITGLHTLTHNENHTHSHTDPTVGGTSDADTDSSTHTHPPLHASCMMFGVGEVACGDVSWKLGVPQASPSVGGILVILYVGCT